MVIGCLSVRFFWTKLSYPKGATSCHALYSVFKVRNLGLVANILPRPVTFSGRPLSELPAALAVLNSGLFAVYAILVPSVGILIIGLIMLRGPFNKATAYSALGAGILGIIAVVGLIFLSALGLFAIFSSVLTTVWVLFAGYRLLRLE